MSELTADSRLRLLQELARCTAGAADGRAVLLAAMEALAGSAEILPRVAVYLSLEDGAKSEAIALSQISREQAERSTPTGFLATDCGDFMELIAAQLNGALAQAEIKERSAPLRTAEEQLLLLVRGSSALLSRPDTPDVLQDILALAQQFIAADAYAVWRRQNEAGVWRAIAVSGLTAGFDSVTSETVIGAVPRTTMFCDDVFANPVLANRWGEYRKEGIRSMMTVPLRIRGAVAGAVAFYYRTPRRFTAIDNSIATALGNLAAAAINISELYAEQKDGKRRALFLARAASVLASSLEVETTLSAIARLTVPEIADWCTIDLADPQEILRRVSVHHSDPAKMIWAKALFERSRLRPESPLVRVLETGETLLVEEITDEHLRQGSRSPEHYEGLRAAGLKSGIFASLHVHGEKMGVISLFMADSNRRYTADDIPAVEDLAARAAFAVHSSRLHQAVLESAERLRISTAAAGLGIFEWNIESGTVLWENAKVYEIFGRTREQGPWNEDEFFGEVLHPEDVEPMRVAIAESMKPDSSFQAVCRVFRADRELRVVEFAGRFDFTPGGAPKRLIGVVADITEKKRLEERLREAAKLESIGVLAGGVAHDFNNLLTGIMGHSSLALEVLETRHEAYGMIRNVLLASERAAALTRQLLAYSGRGKFVLEQVDLSQLIREIVALIRVSIPKTADLRLELAEGLPSVEADPAEMQQLAMNLIINAAESLDRKRGTVRIRTGVQLLGESETARLPQAFEIRAGRYVCFEVCDTGCGMDEVTKRKMFDPFFTTKFTGRGLGLSAVMGIVRGHKGSLEVESAPGQGTTFRVFLPMSEAADSTMIGI